ncbi:hypothetical protein Tco_0617389, partial [Tanacetum coccineum]
RKIPESPGRDGTRDVSGVPGPHEILRLVSWFRPCRGDPRSPLGYGDGDVNRFPNGDRDGDGDEAEKRG